MAWIWRCCGSGVDRWLQPQLDLLAWEPLYPEGAALEKTKNKQTNKHLGPRHKTKVIAVTLKTIHPTLIKICKISEGNKAFLQIPLLSLQATE